MNDQTPFQNDNAAKIIALREIDRYLDGAKTALLGADANLVCARAFLEAPVDAALLGGIAYDLEGLARRLDPVRRRVGAELCDLIGGGGDGDDQGTDGAGAEANRGVPFDQSGTAHRKQDPGPTDDGKGPPRGQG